jgi:hypothetical protein
MRRIVKVLDRDPDLGAALGERRMQQARLEARAAVWELTPGEWASQTWSQTVRDGLGLLVLNGLMVRRVRVDGRFGAEVLTDGDLLRPWQEEDAVASQARTSRWKVLEGAQVAVLDLAFARRIAAYPEIQGQLIARTLRRARYLAVIMAIVHQPKVEARLLMLLWHLADRRGVVRSDGVLVPVRLTHTTLADLLAARRPTVSAALSSLQKAGSVTSTREGWILHGRAPGELLSIPGAE